MAKLLVIAPPELIQGFRLAGIAAEVTHSADETKQKLLHALESAEYALVAFPEEDAVSFDERTRRRCDQTTRPLLLPFPMTLKKTAGYSAKEYVSQIVRRAVGYQVKI